ncbi:MAG: LUD domain-containing protein [Desulfobacterales bacterium]|nr:LUD domain-containing protein [Desulfobacterales bacterium]MBS3756411.1 LUD domain-containing protein [Desulfobacterales bacterium]
MSVSVRDQILVRLRQAPARAVAERPPVALPKETGLARDDRIEAFCARFAEQTGIVYHRDPARDIGETLAEICREHGIIRVISGFDSVLAASGLPDAAMGIPELEIRTQAGFADREEFAEAVFAWADAGLTGADYGVAESGSLVLAFDRNHARLLSLAPGAHIAVLPRDRVVGAYEQAMAELGGAREKPSQIAFVTGPSMTADIQGMPFKGMHGPGKIIVFLV